MKLTLESTEKIVTIESAGGQVPARVWQGTTESGVDVVCFITRVAVRRDADQSEFQRDLAEAHAVMTDDVRAIPARLVL